MNEGELNDPFEDLYLAQVEEKVKMTQWNLDLMSDLNGQIEDHFNRKEK